MNPADGNGAVPGIARLRFVLYNKSQIVSAGRRLNMIFSGSLIRSMTAKPSPVRILLAAALFLLPFGTAAYLYTHNPYTTTVFPCLFHIATGLDCPGCGMSRALFSLMHFDFTDAFRYNMFVFFFVPFAGYWWARLFCYLITGKAPAFRRNIPAGVIFLVLFALIGFDILRNIPVSPFSYFKV